MCLMIPAVMMMMSSLCCRSTEGEEEEEVVHMGNAIMSFYSALIDLLGRCAPEMHVRTFIVDQIKSERHIGLCKKCLYEHDVKLTDVLFLTHS